jgi:hypothetical protein
MIFEDSLQCRQKNASDPRPQPVKSNQRPPTQISFCVNIIFLSTTMYASRNFAQVVTLQSRI